jgi:hypothetical protein
MQDEHPQTQHADSNRLYAQPLLHFAQELSLQSLLNLEMLANAAAHQAMPLGGMQVGKHSLKVFCKTIGQVRAVASNRSGRRWNSTWATPVMLTSFASCIKHGACCPSDFYVVFCPAG